MKNLVLSNHKLFRLRASAPTPASSTPPLTLDTTNTSISLDHSRQVVYYVDTALNFRAYHLLGQKELLCVPLITEAALIFEEDEDDNVLLSSEDRIVSIQYVQENESVVIIATNDEFGQIISVSTSGIVPLPTVGGSEYEYEAETSQLSAAAMSFFTPAAMIDAEEQGESELGAIEVIGQIEGGFSSAVWSPDRELLVLGCNNGTIIVMSNTYDVIGESPITGAVQQQQQLAQANPYVHLSGTIQHKEYQELTKSNELIKTDVEQDIAISWRGDSQYFVTNSLKFNADKNEYVRYLRVWSRQCTLTSQSEPIPSAPTTFTPFQIDPENTADNAYVYHQGMSRHLAWRPSGNIIATINTTRSIHGNTGAVAKTTTTATAPQYMTQQHVQFYERNGLPRYSFPLHEPTLPGKHSGFVLLDMQWNNDSTILTISMYDLSRQQLLVKCFTTKNYHWYCKFTYTLPISLQSDVELTSAKFTWQYNRHTRLIIVSNNTTIHCLDLVEDNYASAAPLYTNAVVDGRVLGLTHFSRAAIPPPLSSRQLLFHSDISNVHMCNTIDPRSITYENSCIQSMPDIPHRLATASTNGMRADIVSPLVILTTTNELLFVTDAVEFGTHIMDAASTTHHNKAMLTTFISYNAAENTIKPTVFAPDYQPERQQALGRSVSTAKPVAFGTISLRDIASQVGSEDLGLTYWRHVQWVFCQQWRLVLIHFTLENQKQAITAKSTSFNAFLTSNGINVNSNNIVTVIQTAPDAEYDTLVIISFTFDLIYNSTTDLWSPSVVVENVKTHILNPSLCESILDATPDANQTDAATEPALTTIGEHQMSAVAVELCPNTITRVSTIPLSKPYPVAPDPPVEEEPATPAGEITTLSVIKKEPIVDPALDIDWLIKHEEAIQSPPLLSLLTSHGHIIQIPIHNELTTKAILTCRKNQLPPDCLLFTVTSMHGDIVYIGLDQQQRLLINHTVIAPQCMSFSLVQFSDVQAYPLPPTIAHANISLQQTGHGQIPTYVSNQQLSQLVNAMKAIPQGLFPSYLLVTVASQQHALFTVDLLKSIDDNINPMSQLRQDPNMVRVVEKGAHLVQCIPDILRPRVVVQQPRGNIELITPRSLGLTSIFCALLCKQYNIAFRSLRTNKIDLNLLIDHNRDEFVSNIVTILQELYLPDNITLLLSSLTNEDCTQLPPTNSNFQMQYPRYHQMFTSQPTMKRLMKIYLLCQQFTSSIAPPSTSIRQSISTSISHLADLDMQLATTANIFSPATRTQMLEFITVSVTPTPTDSSKHVTPAITASMHTQEENVKDLTVIEQFVLSNMNYNPKEDGEVAHNDLDEIQPTQGEDLELLRKQLLVKKAEEHERRRQNNNKDKLKSTAQSFSNRTRVHKQMGNDTTNDNNKYESALGEEAGMKMTADGSGQVYFQQLSRVEHWGVGEMDVRHVYSSAERLMKMYDHTSAISQSTTSVAGAVTVIGNDPSSTVVAPAELKVNQICNVVLETLNNIILTPKQSATIQLQRQQYLLSILTAHLRKSPPDFIAAMDTLQTTAKQESSVSNKINAGSSGISVSTAPRQVTLGPLPALDKTSNQRLNDFSLPSITAEKALKYMLILADKDELWKAALSTYNLTLSQSVAEHSGRDPKEYVPFLTTLANILKCGPALTALQASPALVSQQRADVIQFLTTTNPQLGNRLAPFAEQTPTMQELNAIALPSHLGIHLQHAYIDIYLKQYPTVIIHYYHAMRSIQELLQTVADDSVTDETLCVAFAVNSLAEVNTAVIKYGFILQSIFKLVINYVDDFPYLFHFVIHLFCSPLPAQILPPAKATSDAQQAKIPTIAKAQLHIFSTHQYKLLLSYGLWLVQNAQYHDAAYIYLHLGHVNDAVTCWANSGDYRNVLIYIQRYPYLFPLGDIGQDINKAEITTTAHHTRVQLYTKLSNVLIDKYNNYTIAAQLQYYQLQSPSVALQTLFTYKEWKQAMLYATNYITSNPSTDFDVIFAQPMQVHIDKEIASIRAAMEQYASAVARLRLVRLVKQLIFGAQANNPQCIAIYNKGAVELGNITGLIPRPNLVLRIPGDDVLEFVITGCWRGQQTGLDMNGEGFVGSIGGLSTASGVSMVSLSPSIAQSIQSLSSAFSGKSGISQISHGRLSNGSAMSSGQGSLLSLGAAETALTADERRLKKHMSKLKSKQSRKKVRGGDPREEEKLLLDIAYLTPRTKRLTQWYELIDVCGMCNSSDNTAVLMTLIDDYVKLVKKEESTPMYIIDTFSSWQKTAIGEYFNWPQASYVKDEEAVAKDYQAKLKEEADDKLKQELSHMSKQQKAEWDRSQSQKLQKELYLHVYQQGVPHASTAAFIAGDHLNPTNKSAQVAAASTKGGASKDKHLVAQQKHHHGPTTLEQQANENAQQQVWKSVNPSVETLCKTLPTLSVLTRLSTNTADGASADPNAINVYEILLDQILADLKSTRRTTQLRMSRNDFGQKSLSQKLMEDLTQ